MKLGTKQKHAFAMTTAAGLALAALVAAPPAASQDYVCTEGAGAECHPAGGQSPAPADPDGVPYGPFYHENRHGAGDPTHGGDGAS